MPASRGFPISMSMNLSQGSPGRIRELDGWRGISILLVILGHCMYIAFPKVTEHLPLLRHVFAHTGELGVQIFFVISGFVITRLLLAEERERGSISLKGFYTRRFFRIVPVYYFFLLVVSILSWPGWIPESWPGRLAALLFLRDTKLVPEDWFLGHSWSLAVEEQFYIAFPFLWILWPSRRRGTFLFGTLAIFLAWRLLAHLGIVTGVMGRSAISGFCCINIGALLAIFAPKVLRYSSRLPSLPVLMIAALLFLHPAPQSGLLDSLYSVLAPFGVALMLTHSIGRKTWVSSLLKTRAIQWLGLVSYSAYLWQELFVGAPSAYGSPIAAQIFHWMLPLIPLIAALSFYWIERPCTRFGRKVATRLSGREALSVEPVVAAS